MPGNAVPTGMLSVKKQHTLAKPHGANKRRINLRFQGMIKNMRYRSWLAAVAAFLLIFPNPRAWAWGSEGHRIIADIAWDH